MKYVTRVERVGEILAERKFFKLVCGAGNDDPVEVKRLSMVYTLAGATAIDVSANPLIVKSARDGITSALRIKDGDEVLPCHEDFLRVRHFAPFVMVSLGLEGDPHIRKANIDLSRCTTCGLCFPICEQKAIDFWEDSYITTQKRCIGCGKCADVCPSDAIIFTDTKRDIYKTVAECLNFGAEMVELHAATPDFDIEEWKIIHEAVSHNYISLSLDRGTLSNKKLLSRIHATHAIRGKMMMVQADGVPMGGGKNDMNTTLQAIATADIVIKSGIPVPVLASGGTNSLTRALADICGVPINGVSLGTFARKEVHRFISLPDFEENPDAIRGAVNAATDLVKRNIGCGKP